LFFIAEPPPDVDDTFVFEFTAEMEKKTLWFVLFCCILIVLMGHSTVNGAIIANVTVCPTFENVTFSQN